MRYHNQKLEGLIIRLDDDEVVSCHLVDCQILFGGRRLPVYFGNHAVSCDFRFADAALLTIQVLRRMLSIPALREVVLAELGLLSAAQQTIH
jgi:hypothetical protein